MSLALMDDYFSFMSDKLGNNPVPEDLDAGFQRVQATVRPDVIDWVPPSQMEVTESALGDTAIQRIFSPPNDG